MNWIDMQLQIARQRTAIREATETRKPVRFGDTIAYPPGIDGITTLGCCGGIDKLESLDR